MSIPLPPLPEAMHGFYATPMYSLDQLRARDQEIVRVVLEAAADACEQYQGSPEKSAEIIRALEFRHHE